ncbi:MAG: hypothetical protein PHP10_01065 [Candidatus Omnitrophica bacterium]|nr:hypothetical protein [Candidatus Omnitrophota bacterium]
MLIFIRIVGIYMAVMGALILLVPKCFGKIVDFFMIGKRIYLAGFLRLALGFIFVVTAWQSRQTVFIYSLGVLIIMGGTLLFAFRKDTIKAMVSWLDSRPAGFIRFWGVAAAAFGALIIYSA